MNHNFYEQMIKEFPIGYAYNKIICDINNVPCDFQFVEVNDAFETLTGLKSSDIIGKMVTEILPSIKQSNFDWIKFYGDIAINGGKNETQQYVEFLHRHYKVYVSSPEKFYFIIFFSDIGNEINKLKQSEENYRLLIDNSHDIIYTLDKEGIVTFASKSLKKVLGYSNRIIVGKQFKLFVHPEDVEKCIEFLHKIANTKKSGSGIEYRLRHIDGTWRWYNSNVVPLLDSNLNLVGFEGSANDIDDKKTMEHQLLTKQRMLKAIADSTKELLENSEVHSAISNCMAIIGRVTFANKVYYYKNNYENDNLLYTTSQKAEWDLNTSKLQIDNKGLRNVPFENIIEIINPLSKGMPFSCIVKNLQNGITKQTLEQQSILSILVLPIFIESKFWGFVGFDEREFERVWTQDEIILLMSFANSIAGAINRKNSENKIEYLSYNDMLTGLHNRRFYEKTLEKIDEEQNAPLAVVLIDVNGLKLTNDAFGHKAGDKLLEKVAYVLKRECRTEDIISRIGGDEFVLLLPETDAKNADKIIRRINIAMANEKMDNIILSVSIGFAVKRDVSDNINDVFKEAEDAMYKNKLSESSKMRTRTIKLIIDTLYQKNNREMLHSKSVSRISEAIATSMNLDRDSINKIRITGLMHDIGKIGIDENILNKPERLNTDEWNEIERHSEIGYRILGSASEFTDISKDVLEHHERWDGRGYPRGLKGEEISLHARIIAVADAYDAMTGVRSYRKALSKEQAIIEMKKNSGTQLDPSIVDVFIEKVMKKI